jgi:predicted dehydrogenase
MADKEYRVGIVGYGQISRVMAPFLLDCARISVVAVVDTDSARLVAAKEKLPGVAAVPDLAALRETPLDALIVNTPAESHYSLAVAALERGAHVLVAKPLTLEIREATDLVRRARAAALTVSVGHQLRYTSHYTAVRQLVESGRLGTVEAAFLLNSKPRPNAANLSAMAHPALLEAACHHFDSMSAVLGGLKPTWVSCDGYNPSWSPYRSNSMVNALVRYEDGTRLLYHGGFSAQASMYQLRLEGTRGVVRCRGYHMSDSRMSYEIAGVGQSFESIELEAGMATRDGRTAWEPFLDAWVKYLDGGDEPPFSASNNVSILSLLAAAVESTERQVPVDLDGTV